MLRKCAIIGDKPLKKNLKKERGHFKQRTSNKKGRGILTLFGTTAGRFTELLLNPLSVRDLFSVWTKLKESIFKSNNQINSVTTRIWLLSTKWTRTWPGARAWYMNQKMMVHPPFLNGRFVFQNARVSYRINKYEGDEFSLSLLFEEMLSIHFFWNI